MSKFTRRGQWIARFLTASAVLGVATVTAQAQNLLTNADFSLGNTGFSSTYTYFTGSPIPEGRYVVDRSPRLHHPLQADFGDHTTGTGLMLIFNGGTLSDVYNWPIWEENVTVTPFQEYEFSGWITTANSTDGSPSRFDARVNGVPIFTSFISPTTGGTWKQFTAHWNSGNTTTANIKLFNTNTQSLGNDSALDDFSFRGVPEPGTVTLLAVVALPVLGILSAHRRMRH